jgi:hypothetical protein
VDKVKLGRALGKGARGAAKSLWEAAEAVAADDPRGKGIREKGAAAVEQVAEVHRTVKDAKRQVRNAAVAGAKQGGKSALAPVKKFTGVLWLEVTGTFFAIFTLVLAQATWRSREGFAPAAAPEAMHKAWLYAGLCVLFLYFAVSSFVRARRRERR